MRIWISPREKALSASVPLLFGSCPTQGPGLDAVFSEHQGQVLGVLDIGTKGYCLTAIGVIEVAVNDKLISFVGVDRLGQLGFDVIPVSGAHTRKISIGLCPVAPDIGQISGPDHGQDAGRVHDFLVIRGPGPWPSILNGCGSAAKEQPIRIVFTKAKIIDNVPVGPGLDCDGPHLLRAGQNPHR